jgi:diacylglycerol O-acyltransferase / wax synthase
MKVLSGVDGAFLHLETLETPMHVASLHLFDLPDGYRGDFHADITRLMCGRLHLAPVFTRKLAPMPLQFANPVWIEEDKLDLAYTCSASRCPPPARWRSWKTAPAACTRRCWTAAARCGGSR